MADNDRALYFANNTGIEALAVAERDLYNVENVGTYAVLLARGLYAVENVGIYLVLLARALYDYENISENTGESDGLETLLVNPDLLTILWFLRGK